MRLFFLRHGEAVPGSSYLSDFDRPLTEDGRVELEGVTRGLRRLKLSRIAIRSSPLVRARETAEIVAPLLDSTFEIVESLRSGATFDAFQSVISHNRASEALMFIGHEPDFSDAVGTLLGTSGEALVLKKAGALRIDIHGRPEQGKGRLRWLLTPAQLVLIGGAQPSPVEE